MSEVSLEVKELFAVAFKHQNKNEFLQAENIYKKILNISPNDIATLNNLGNVLRVLKKYKESIYYFDKALNIKPRDIITNYNLGLLFYKLEEFEKSAAFYKKVVEIDSKHVQSYHNLMDIYEKTNNHQKLEAIIAKANNFLKDNFIIKLYEGILLFKNEKFQQAIKILETFVFNERNIKQEQLRILTLGKCYDGLKNPDKAYSCFVKSNEISSKLKNQNINKNIYLQEIKRREKFFIKFKKEKWSNLETVDKNINPIFMVGFPRSGTTLLDTILRSHPKIEVIEEKSTVSKLVSSLKDYTKNDFNNFKTLEIENLKKIRNLYFENLNFYSKNKNSSKIYIDKLPLNIIHIGEILRVFPNAKFIISIRHPCDCVLSCFMQSFTMNNAMANFVNLEDAAILYDAVMKLWMHYVSVFNMNYHEIRYESLVKNLEVTIRPLLKFLELKWNDSVLEFQQTAKKRTQIKTPSYDQVIKPIYSEASGRWKIYQKQIKNIYPILDPWIKKFNY